jgi:iron complex outermembrane receptor protein
MSYFGEVRTKFVPSLGGLLRICVVTLASVVALPLFAQTSTEPPKTQEEEDRAKIEKSQVGVQSEEIVVTARKREENLQEVPIAVSVVTSDKLEEAATADISELQGQVPNLAI